MHGWYDPYVQSGDPPLAEVGEPEGTMTMIEEAVSRREREDKKENKDGAAYRCALLVGNIYTYMYIHTRSLGHIYIYIYIP